MELWQAILLAAVVTIGSGFSLRTFHDRKVRKHQARIDNRLAAGEDRYFEELRELEAYDPRNNPPWQNLLKEILILSVGFVGLAVFLAGLEL